MGTRRFLLMGNHRSGWDLEELTKMSDGELERHLRELLEERKLTEAMSVAETNEARNARRIDIEPNLIVIDRDITLIRAEIERRKGSTSESMVTETGCQSVAKRP